MEALFKIEQGNTGLFSTGGIYPRFTKKGKIWQGWAPLKAHLRLFSHTKYAKSLDGMTKKFVLFKLPSYLNYIQEPFIIVRVDANPNDGHCHPDHWSRIPIQDFVKQYMKFDSLEAVEKYEKSYVLPKGSNTRVLSGYFLEQSKDLDKTLVETYDLKESYALYINKNSTPLVICNDFKVLCDLQTFLHSYRGQTANLSLITGIVEVTEKKDLGTC